MGNTLSIVFKSIAPCLTERVKYISGLEDNLKALEDAILKLEARSADVLAEVGIQERQGLLPLQEVRLWLSDVEAIGPPVCLLLDASAVELERLCMYGYCSSDFCTSYPYAKEVWKKLKIVELLLSAKRADEIVARRGLPPDMEEGPTRHTIGLESMLEMTWKRLMEDEVGILGLYGMGGVGKTTLLEHINNKFLERNYGFDVVISVVVSQDLQIGRIQKEIAKRLGLSDQEWEQKTKNEKASDIKKVLTRKRFVMLLDDIWTKVDLEEIGVPQPSTENRSKVVFTTRSKEVCGRMGADVDMEVKCLEPEEAWKFFQKKVRAKTLASDPKIPKLARKVCEKCKGLPLALSVIGETMACKTTVREWLYAIDVLDSYAAENPKVEDEILKILKFSYDDLKDERVQQCFQYCALFPEDHQIDKNMLVDYWICEGIIVGDREKAMNQGYGIIGILVSACLLMNFENTEKVIMHDVVRQMALWIASNFGEEREKFVVRTGAGLHEMPEVRNWNAVRRMSLQNSKIRNISVTPDCSNLTTLLLRNNKLVNISGAFFRSMSKLKVLDLSWNQDLYKLPEEISMLVSLQYLSLEGTYLKNLPAGAGELIQLRHLNLDTMFDLQSISVVFSLLNLETLKVCNAAPIGLKSLENIKLLKKLQNLSISIRDFLALECLLRTPRFASCTHELHLQGLEAKNGIVFVGVLASLQKFVIANCDISNVTVDLRNTTSVCVGVRPSDVCFQNLKTVRIGRLRGMEDLTWLLFAPSLTSLAVSGPSPELKEIISRKKAADILNGRHDITPLGELKMMSLHALEELTSIYWEPLPFPFLAEVSVHQCPKLKKLPFDMESSKGNRIKLVVNTEQFEGFEWEDEATKERFSTTSGPVARSIDPYTLFASIVVDLLLKPKSNP